MVVSIHAPRAGCDHTTPIDTQGVLRFNSRTPCGVRPVLITGYNLLAQVSIHAPRAGCDKERIQSNEKIANVSIHAPRAGCDKVEQGWVPSLWVSIHAPRAGCDTSFEVGAMAIAVSIHAPRAGCD